MNIEQQMFQKFSYVHELASKNKCEIGYDSCTFQIRKNDESIAAFETINEVLAFFYGYEMKDGKKKK